MTSIKTQKAVGIIHGISTLIDDNPAMSYFVGEIDNQLIRVEENIDLSYIRFPCFARPCPVTPRHGFVESRIVKNKKQLKELWKEVKAQDPDGEIIVGPFVKNPTYNAVYVSSGTLSIGPGNDGATGGKNSISFPVAPEKFDDDFMEMVRIKNPDVIYLESVHNRKAGWHLTQVRGGPVQKGGKKDYIPHKTKVKSVTLPDDNLLEWEKKVKTLAPGTVVYGAGHTLASHAAVHCIIHRIPFVTSFKPNVGSTIQPTERKKSKNHLNRNQFRKGIIAALSKVNKDPKKDIGFSLAVLHNWAYLRKSEDASWILAAAATLFVRLGTALVFGEYRHGKGGPKGSRDNIYKKVISKGSEYLYRTPEAFNSFHKDHWSDSFGGIAWANCAWYSYDIWKNIINIYNKKGVKIDQKEILPLIENINRAINLAHNSGWWFNKVAEESLMDFAADSPGLLAFCTADMFSSLKKSVRKISNVKTKLPCLVDIKPPFARDADNRVVWAYISDHFNSDVYLTIRVGEDDNEGYHNKNIHLTAKERVAVKEGINANKCRRIYLEVEPGKGFKLPGGRIISYKGIKAAA